MTDVCMTRIATTCCLQHSGRARVCARPIRPVAVLVCVLAIARAATAQDAMKRHTIRATMAVMIATALHAIATGNMLPAFVTEPDGTLREMPTICVDSAEFVVSKLKDRGTHQAFGVVTNAQDFMHILRLFVERELDSPDISVGSPRAAAAVR